IQAPIRAWEDRMTTVRMLVLDDSAQFCEMLRDYAEMCRHEYTIECKHSNSTTEALEIMADWSPTIMLVDAHLSDGDAFELVDRFSDSSSSVVVVADSHSQEIEASARARGADGYLCKSENPDHMESLLYFLMH